MRDWRASADADLRGAMAAGSRARGWPGCVALAQAAHDDLARPRPRRRGLGRWRSTRPPTGGPSICRRRSRRSGGAAAPTAAELLATSSRSMADRLSLGRLPMVPAGAARRPGRYRSSTRLKRDRSASWPAAPTCRSCRSCARALLPVLRPTPDLDSTWLEIVAAVRPRLAPLEARQLDATAADLAGGRGGARTLRPIRGMPSGPVLVGLRPGRR